MDTLIGIRGRDFVAVATDTYEKYGVITMKNDDDGKIMQIDDSKLLLLAGPLGDRSQFGEYIRKSVHYLRYKTSFNMTTKSMAHFVRQQLAEYLRKSPYQVDLLVAGYDFDGPQLFWVDYLASSTSIDRAVHGYGGNLLRGLLDKEYHENLTVEDAVRLLKKCRHEVKNRFLLSQSNFRAKVIDKNGVHDVSISDEDTPEVFKTSHSNL
ncbi:proteasome subunit beta type 2 [Theileria orientalis strain Shintoku]|uniref:Proteasome subunit beta n=1 Tax=Theileria orientalis strain Shintoku TaxID=869250 RepID=J7MGS3_THEOR|nr:proteasome subunit beta type 2 [Theileria orientalis strain Shintoku]PVC54224.1 proteasome subunit beta type 2 [Theileria orientalis]BAM38706.1 proteasome subunit beta type 2 [Theileria orientalis strain Shintoku]|eukprot:XP_009689007.1 proteasome subunit beta type 2 [Theileria orientalis strain Shintoku]